MMNKLRTIIIILFISILFSFDYSRMRTSWDMPSDYMFSKDYLSDLIIDTEETFDVPGSICIAYEQSIFNRKKINGLLGAEFMLGKDSNITMAFHSVYIMPIISITDNAFLNFKLGYTKLITDHDIPISDGWMFSLGPEFKISENWAINFSNTWYEISDGSFEVDFEGTPGLDLDNNLQEAELKMDYNKFAVSIVYGFMRKDEGENK